MSDDPICGADMECDGKKIPGLRMKKHEYRLYQVLNAVIRNV
jgi:hypothetical protein